MGNFRSSAGNICPVCDYSPVDINVSGINDPLYYYDCPNCGCFFAPSHLSMRLKESIFSFDLNHLREYLFYNQRSELRPVLCDKDYYDKHITDEFVQVYNVTPEMVENWYPRNFSEKVDLILQKLDDLAEYDGAYIKAGEFIDKLFFCENARSSGVKEGCDNTVQLEYMSDFLSLRYFFEVLMLHRHHCQLVRILSVKTKRTPFGVLRCIAPLKKISAENPYDTRDFGAF